MKFPEFVSRFEMEPVVCPPIKRRNLAIFLERVAPLPTPRADLEQYATPAEIAARVLYKAYGLRDVYERAVADLGCGNGILALGAARIGAAPVLGIDADPEAIAVARDNAESLGLSVEFRTVDVREFQESVDTIFMNPPFGGQRKHADRPFLKAALGHATVAYSFHNAVTRRFVERAVADLGGTATHLATYKFPLPLTQPFHERDRAEVDVDLFRIVRTSP